MMEKQEFENKRSYMNDLGIEIINIDKSNLPARSLLVSIFRNFFSSLPLIVHRYQFKQYNNKVKELCSSGNYDLLHCDSIALAPVLNDIDNIPKVLTEHNVEALIWERYYQQEKNIFKKWYIRSQYKKILKFEIDTARICEHVITVSDEDKKRLNKISGVSNITVVPNGVDTSFFDPSGNSEEKFNLVFTGSMDWRPNQDALDYLMEDIYPLIMKKYPDIQLWLVGRRPSGKIVSYGKKYDNVHVTGEVEDVRPFVNKSAVFVVPLRIGGGSRLKILEAWSMSKAVVSTSVGAEGLSAVHGDNILIADEADHFAETVMKLIEDDQLRKVLGEKGRKTAEEKYDWSKIAVINRSVWDHSMRK